MATTEPTTTKTDSGTKPEPLHIEFHGRVLEHLGIQMYQSPVNALSEFVANAWDADSTEVRITYPDKLTADAEIIIADDGIGMTRDECQKRFLKVGYNRRGNNPDEKSRVEGRPILGRKGIGKFAGFGIAEVMRIDTISYDTGKRTVFELNLNDLVGEHYVATNPKVVTEYTELPDAKQRFGKSGTVVTLTKLRLKQNIRKDFPLHMARRFLLLELQTGFNVLVNDNKLPQSTSTLKVQYSFPQDYTKEEKPAEIIEIKDSWGREKLGNGKEILWRFLFHEDPIGEEDLRGITIYAKGKLVQAPFWFLVPGGISGEHGMSYLSGQVQADYLDLLDEDITTTERQRINWDDEQADFLLKWGDKRLRQLLDLWRDRRGASRREQIEKKVTKFSDRLEKLPPSERKTVRTALQKLGSVPSLDDAQFEELAIAILTAWEQGRLKELINKLAATDDPSAEQFVALLAEESVLSALNIAEAVTSKIHAVQKLLEHIDSKTLENDLRDYIAEQPWLISPQYETYSKETTLRETFKKNLKDTYINPGDLDKRTDLILRRDDHLVVVEFMRPGLKIDWDHLDRFQKYIRAIESYIEANTGLKLNRVTGLIVADSISDKGAVIKQVQALEKSGLLALDWRSLLSTALEKWKDYLRSLSTRQQEDPRFKKLLEILD